VLTRVALPKKGNTMAERFVVKSPFKTDILTGKTLLISGGATGIGFGIATVFAQHGARVVIMGRRQNVLDEAVKKFTDQGFSVAAVQGDVRNPQSCAQAVQTAEQKFGGVDILCNCAAGNFMCSAEELSENGFKTVIEIDLQGSFNMSKAALPSLKESAKRGNNPIVINITATLHYTAMPFQIHAASAKAGVDVLTQTMGVEWGEYGIRSVGIAPGPVRATEGGTGGRVFEGAFVSSTDKNHVKMQVPLGRYGEVEDVGMTALFLASDAATWITATTVVVDGGNWHKSGMMFHGLKNIISRRKDQEKQTREKRAKL